MTTSTFPNSHSSTLSSRQDAPKNNHKVLEFNIKHAKTSLHSGPDACLRGLRVLLCNTLPPRYRPDRRALALNTLTGSELTKHFCFPGQQVFSTVPCAIFFLVRQFMVEKNHKEVTLPSPSCSGLHLSCSTSPTDTENKDRIPTREVRHFSLLATSTISCQVSKIILP